METFLRAAAVAIVGAILAVVVRKETKELGVVLSLACCALLLVLIWDFLEPVVDFARRLNRMTTLSGEMIGILLKAAGVGLLCEAACAVCEDAGESTLGKITKICGSATVLYLSLPLFQSVLDLIEGLLGG